MEKTTLMTRRQNSLASFYYHMFEDPLHIVRGEGVWLWDAAGRKYLDCYNNVPSVGHSHPRVVSALCNQAAMLNTHTRYLHEGIVTLAERLLRKLPEQIDTSAFVCTGSEANDLAVQMARHFTGATGVIVSEGAYHGNTDLTLRFSPSEYPAANRPDWLGVLEPPNLYRGSVTRDDPDAGQKYLALAIKEMDAVASRGQRIACVVLETSWDSDGPLLAPQDYVTGLCEEVRARGGLIVCDEVQAGYCRLGEHWWGFENYGIDPDIVTCGKPMGAGHPVAGVFMRSDIADALARRNVYFNTFGGNPVSAAVANAVIDVIEDEELLENSRDTGGHFLTALNGLKQRHEVVGDIQGSGLFYGLDLVTDRHDKLPFSRANMASLGNMIAEEGVITGVSGRYGQTLKLRPPLTFGKPDVDMAVTAIDRALTRFSQQKEKI